MKTVTLIISVLIFLMACGQTTQKESALLTQANVEGFKNDRDIAELWSDQLQQLTFVRQLDTKEVKKSTIDLSSILAYDKNKNEYLSWFIGALGPNYQRIDLLLLSAKHLGQQTYSLQMLFKKEEKIDTLNGKMNLKTAFEVPDDILKLFIYSFDYKFCSNDKSVCLEGINSISFYVEENLPKNYWYEDGTFNDYVRTFAGVYIDKKTNKKINCVFAVRPAGLYNYLPFCEDFFTVNEEDNPEYYYISEKYKKFGWESFDYYNPKKDKWWKE